MENYPGKLRKESSPKSLGKLDSPQADRSTSFSDSKIYINRTLRARSKSLNWLQNIGQLSAETQYSVLKEIYDEDPVKADSEQPTLPSCDETPSMEGYSREPRKDLFVKFFKKTDSPPVDRYASFSDSEIYINRTLIDRSKSLNWLQNIGQLSAETQYSVLKEIYDEDPAKADSEQPTLPSCDETPAMEVYSREPREDLFVKSFKKTDSPQADRYASFSDSEIYINRTLIDRSKSLNWLQNIGQLSAETQYSVLKEIYDEDPAKADSEQPTLPSCDETPSMEVYSREPRKDLFVKSFKKTDSPQADRYASFSDSEIYINRTLRARSKSLNWLQNIGLSAETQYSVLKEIYDEDSAKADSEQPTLPSCDETPSMEVYSREPREDLFVKSFKKTDSPQADRYASFSDSEIYINRTLIDRSKSLNWLQNIGQLSAETQYSVLKEIYDEDPAKADSEQPTLPSCDETPSMEVYSREPRKDLFVKSFKKTDSPQADRYASFSDSEIYINRTLIDRSKSLNWLQNIGQLSAETQYSVLKEIYDEDPAKADSEQPTLPSCDETPSMEVYSREPRKDLFVKSFKKTDSPQADRYASFSDSEIYINRTLRARSKSLNWLQNIGLSAETQYSVLKEIYDEDSAKADSEQPTLPSCDETPSMEVYSREPRKDLFVKSFKKTDSPQADRYASFSDSEIYINRTLRARSKSLNWLHNIGQLSAETQYSVLKEMYDEDPAKADSEQPTLPSCDETPSMEGYSREPRKDLFVKSFKKADSSQADRYASFSDSEIYINRTLRARSKSLNWLQNIGLSAETQYSVLKEIYDEDPAKADSEQPTLPSCDETPSMEGYSREPRKVLFVKSFKKTDSPQADRYASFSDSEIYINRTLRARSKSLNWLQNIGQLSAEAQYSVVKEIYYEDPAKADSEQRTLPSCVETPSMEGYSRKPREDLFVNSSKRTNALQIFFSDSEIYLSRTKERSNISMNTSDAALKKEKFKKHGKMSNDENLRGQKSTTYTSQVTPFTQYDQFYKTTYQSTVPLLMYSAFDKKPSLTKEIWNFYCFNKLSYRKYNSHLFVFSKLTDIITASLRGCSLFLMGSTLSGLGNVDSDIDFNVVLPEKYDGHVTASINEIRIHKAIKILQRSLYKYVRNVSISATLNPKIHFIFEQTTVKGNFGNFVDLTINDSHGMRSTQLIYLYTQCDWRFQPIYNFIKHWALCQSFHGKTESLLSSYSIAIMVIYYLQKGVEPVVLPILHELKTVKFQSNCNEPVELGESRNIQWKSRNNMLLGELTERFFLFYTVFNYKEIAISIRTSEPVQVPANRNSEDTGIFVEEPFSLANIVTSRTGKFMVKEVTKAMNIANNLIRQDKSLNTLLLNYYNQIISDNLRLIK